MVLVKIAVFDSGIGSLSIIKPLRKKVKSEIIYFADQKNFPYGKKSIPELRKIINGTISAIRKNFQPDLIVIGSNTPSILLKKITSQKIIGILPPLREAVKKSKTKSIAVLATKSVIQSKLLNDYVNKNVPRKIIVTKINASPLVELVESGKFLSNRKYCNKIIRRILAKTFEKNNIDAVTLSSTHLPFLLPMLRKNFPSVSFLDPANDVVKRIMNTINRTKSKNSLQILTTGNPKIFQRQLNKLGIKNKVSHFID